MYSIHVVIGLALCGGALAASGAPAAGGQPSASSAQPPSSSGARQSAEDGPASDPALQAEAAVAGNLKTEEGRKFADSAATAANGPLASAWQACRDSLYPSGGAKPESASLQVYALLNRRGMTKALLVRPAGKMEACMVPRLGAALAFPSPPGPNWWVKLGVGTPVVRSGKGP